MSFRHWILNTIPAPSGVSDADLDRAIDDLVMEHQGCSPSIEERCARAEAFAILLIEKVRRLEKE